MRASSILACLLLTIGLSASAEEGYGPLIVNGLDEQLAIGADLFFSETFEGNGRTCATCHAVADNYTLSSEFLATVSDQDPLMVGDPDNPAHVFELELCDSDDCLAIRESGLILVNPDGEANLGRDQLNRSYSMRSIPHVLSMSTSIERNGPPDATGWSGDGAPGAGTLHDFATGAVTQHFTKSTDRTSSDFRDPTGAELDAMEAFQLQLGRRVDINLLELGKGFFVDNHAKAGFDFFFEESVDQSGPQGRCSRCHADAGALDRTRDNENFDTHIEEQRINNCLQDPDDEPPGRCAAISQGLVPGANEDGGFGVDDLDPDDERWGDGTFNTPPLIEAADTAPFFHDNAESSLEEAMRFYRSQEFKDSPSCAGLDLCGLTATTLELITPLGAEVRIGAMLRVLNAGLNLAMASQRLRASMDLLTADPGSDPSAVKTILLAREEVQDALDMIPTGVLFNEQRGVPLFDGTENMAQARAELEAVLGIIDDMVPPDGEPAISGLSVAVLLTNLVSIANNRLSNGGFYHHGADPEFCTAAEAALGYHDCRWLFDLGDANVVYDNAGVTPSIVDGETKLTWSSNTDGTATLNLKWRTAEWTNPLFETTVLTHETGNPSFSPMTFTGPVTRLPSGEYERNYSVTIPRRSHSTYKMTVSARVGGVTETDLDTVTSPSQGGGGPHDDPQDGN